MSTIHKVLDCVGSVKTEIDFKKFIDNGAIASAKNRLMENSKLTELNRLFEKAVSNQANIDERLNLNALYRDFINEGRDMNNHIDNNNIKRSLMNSNVQDLNCQKSILRYVS